MRRLLTTAVAIVLVVVCGPVVGFCAEWQTRTTRHFEFQYHGQQEKVIQRLADQAEQVRSRHCRLVQPCFDGRIAVKVTVDEGEFLDLQPYGAHLDWAAGVAYAPLSLIILRIDKDLLLTIEETFEHEVSHILLLKATKTRPPRWFIEGIAIVQARQNLIEKFEAVASASALEDTMPLSSLDEFFPSTPAGRALAYAKSGLFVSFLVNSAGDAKVRELITALGFGMSLEDAFPRVLGETVADLEEEWNSSMSSFAWLKALTTDWALWTGVTALFLLVVFVKWRRTTRRKREMEVEERDWDFIH